MSRSSINSGYANIRKLVSAGFYSEALSLYSGVHASGFHPDDFTFPFLLKACGKLGSSSQVQTIHTHVLKTGFLHAHVHTATALAASYLKLHLLEDAHNAFAEIPQRKIATINAAISGFSQNGYFKEALEAFKMVAVEGFHPNSVTISSVLPACEIAQQGLQIHGLAIKMGHEMDIYVATAAVTMYSNFRDLGSALRVFELIPEKNMVSCNAMISGLLVNGYPHRVVDLFRKLRGELLLERPSSVTWVSLLSACSQLSALSLGKQLHCFILKHEVSIDILMGTALVDMYSKCGLLKWAQQIFLGLDEKNIVTWNSMISAMLLHGHCEMAVDLFNQLKSQGLEPHITTWNLMISGFVQQGNAIEAFRFFKKMQLAGVVTPSLKSMTSLLKACSAQSDLQHGKEIHGHIVRTVIQNDEFVLTALVDMYMKCGFPHWARQIFDQIAQEINGTGFWNAMIAGYGRNRDNKSAIEIFIQMEEAGVRPNSTTFISLLSACSHAGWVEKGQALFKMMSSDYGVEPTSEHFACVVDLLARAGQLDEAWHLIQEMPKPSPSVFATLLGASRSHSNVKLGEEMAERILEIDPTNPAAFVLLSNIYAEQGKWVEVERLRETMKEKGVKKVPGFSWMAVREEVT